MNFYKMEKYCKEIKEFYGIKYKMNHSNFDAKK
ncbi:hypothetical protein M2254_001210 [Chryseobacterium sp. BIGb0186]|nr:hypothetical protein [Chryseobacterium sp. JUb44]MDH6209626.1 hypothetical protein [Chryseobacterium sp. BIGb0186]